MKKIGYILFAAVLLSAATLVAQKTVRVRVRTIQDDLYFSRSKQKKQTQIAVPVGDEPFREGAKRVVFVEPQDSIKK